jgi:hypothetical protein
LLYFVRWQESCRCLCAFSCAASYSNTKWLLSTSSNSKSNNEVALLYDCVLSNEVTLFNLLGVLKQSFVKTFGLICRKINKCIHSQLAIYWFESLQLFLKYPPVFGAPFKFIASIFCFALMYHTFCCWKAFILMKSKAISGAFNQMYYQWFYIKLFVYTFTFIVKIYII